MRAVYLTLVRVLLLLPGRTPFQQDESGVIDLAGGRKAGSVFAYFRAGVYLCEQNFTQMPVCVRVVMCVRGDVNSENAFVCLPLCDCVNQGI